MIDDNEPSVSSHISDSRDLTETEGSIIDSSYSENEDLIKKTESHSDVLSNIEKLSSIENCETKIVQRANEISNQSG